MRNRIILITISLLFSGLLFGQNITTPEPASRILDEAYSQAKNEKKNVMVIFHASWCGWCKKMDASINDPACKDFFDKSFVIVHLTILESANNKNLENPGAEDIFNENGGKGGGIPYFLIYDANGKLLSDSKMTVGTGADAKRSNIGCPATDQEVAAFINILKKTSKINEKEATAIAERFKLNRS